MTIRTSGPVFLGVVVQPKTKVPIYVQREQYRDRQIEIMGRVASMAGYASEYLVLGEGYLNDDPDYAGPTDVTGYPRSHTPGGVRAAFRGGGYGTCLYTGLVLLAVAQNKRELQLPGLIGSGMGISSTITDSSRSDSADRWWRAAISRGLADTETGDTDGDNHDNTETETLEGEPLEDFMSTRDFRNVTAAIREGVDNQGEWSVSSIDTITVDLEREVPAERESEEIDADFYTYSSAIEHNLVALRECAEGDFLAWSKRGDTGNIEVFKDVILALNVAGEDTRIVSKLALLAKENGATDAEVTKLLMRARFGVDVMPRRIEHVVDVDESLFKQRAASVKPRRLPPDQERGSHRKPPAPNPPPTYKFRRNPTEIPSAAEMTAIERDLRELEQRREDLGWNQIDDLP